MKQSKTRTLTRIFSWTADKIKAFFQHLDFAFLGSAMLWLILIFMSFTFVKVMFSDDTARMVSHWLGIYSSGSKAPRHETLTFIGVMMSGVLAAIGAVAINRRADAQMKNVVAQVENNKLIEKGHINERFKSAVESLGHRDASVRIASYYQFYYLAKEGGEDFRYGIFEILCSRLRSMPHDKSHLTEEYEKKRPTAECQTLLNILLHPNHHVFNGSEPNLQKVCLINADLEGANLLCANLSGADLSYSRICNADLFHANLSDTNLSNTNLSHAHLSRADISNSNLLNADLSHADLTDTNLSSAYLSHTDLSNTNFSRANLSYANLSCAGLMCTNFRDANLINVNFSGAQLLGTDFRGTNLKHTELENVRIERADFRGAKIDNRPITKDDLPADKGEYYADWNPPPWDTPPKKEENKI